MRFVVLLAMLGCGGPQQPPQAPIASNVAPIHDAGVARDAAAVTSIAPDAAPPPPFVVGRLPLVGDPPPGVSIERVIDGWTAVRWPSGEGLAVQLVDKASAWASKAAVLATAKAQSWLDVTFDPWSDGNAVSYRVTDGKTSMYSLIVYRTIAGAMYFCAGNSENSQRRDEMLAFCHSLRPK